MSAIAVISLSNAGAQLAVRLAQALGPRGGSLKPGGSIEPQLHPFGGGAVRENGKAAEGLIQCMGISIRGRARRPCRAVWGRTAHPEGEPYRSESEKEVPFQNLIQCDIFLHKDVARRFRGERFETVVALTRLIFGHYRGLVYIMPCGVAVRAIAGILKHKTTDPAVVALDVGGRYAVSLLSGHEGGANALALRVANALAAEPVISTTTEAVRDAIVGIGCRRGARAADIVVAVRQGLRRAKVRPGRVRWLASADIKKDEAGLIAAAAELGFGLRFISSGEIRGTAKAFRHSAFVKGKVKLPAVAEPAALLAGRRTQLILPKKIIRGVTVAVALENCL